MIAFHLLIFISSCLDDGYSLDMLNLSDFKYFKRVFELKKGSELRDFNIYLHYSRRYHMSSPNDNISCVFKFVMTKYPYIDDLDIVDISYNDQSNTESFFYDRKHLFRASYKIPSDISCYYYDKMKKMDENFGNKRKYPSFGPYGDNFFLLDHEVDVLIDIIDKIHEKKRKRNNTKLNLSIFFWRN